jgi:WXG100 family type VII secretion target
MKLGAKEVEAILSSLSDHVAPVRSEWTGSAQAYFNAFWDQSLQDANGLRTVLVGMATLTETAAAAYEATEKRIAESFGEFRNRPDTAHAGADNVGENLTESGPKLIDTAGVQPAIAQVQGGPENEPVAALEEYSQSYEILTGSASCTEISKGDGFANLEMAEIEDGPIDVADQSTGPSKTNGRPWARFITKSSRLEAGDAIVGAKVPERRFKTSDPALRPGTRLCRLCFTVVSLEPDIIEKTATHDYVRCPHCGNSFPVRHGDVADQGLSQ